MHPKQTIKLKVNPRLKGIGEDYSGGFEIGDGYIDQTTGELVVDIVPSKSEEINPE